MSSFSIYKYHLWSSSRLPACQFQPQHPSTDVLNIPPLYMSKPFQFGFSGFISNTSNMLPSAPPVFSLVLLSLNHTTLLESPSYYSHYYCYHTTWHFLCLFQPAWGHVFTFFPNSPLL
ncbi:hypothetical protein AMECASPLE_023720 [Ameca splendens]|uniref:Uncharacterized protein n=1 Tax=Ameca splendens TaxID=208324 RepID=A0ABV0YG72_9TELE